MTELAAPKCSSYPCGMQLRPWTVSFSSRIWAMCTFRLKSVSSIKYEGEKRRPRFITGD